MVDEDSSDESEAALPVFTRIKNFLISGESWSELRTNFDHRVKLMNQKHTELNPVSEPQLHKSIHRRIHNSFVDRILGCLRRPLPPEKIRLVWTCRCGYRGFDDYEELEEGGVAELAEEFLLRSSVSTASLETSARGPIASMAIFTVNISLRISRAFRGLWHSPVLPISHAVTSSSGDSQGNQLDQNARFLLFCSDSKTARKVPIFEHINLCNTKSDQQLFNHLKTEYKKKNKGLGKYMLQLRNIHFVEFTLRPKCYIDCLRKDQLPPPEKRTEYEWKEAKTLPPVGSRWLMHLLDCPEDASDDIACIEHSPRK